MGSMIIIDANYILRWFLNDIVAQAAVVDALLRSSDPDSIVLDRVTVAEVTYVLRAQKYDHGQVFRLLEELSYYPSVAAMDKVDSAALEIYRDTSLDFEDCVLLAFSKLKNYDIGTFDKDLLKHTT